MHTDISHRIYILVINVDVLHQQACKSISCLVVYSSCGLNNEVIYNKL